MPPLTSSLEFHASLLARGSTCRLPCIGLGFTPLGLDSSQIQILSTLYTPRYSPLDLRGVPQCFLNSWTSCMRLNKVCFIALIRTLIIKSLICCKGSLGTLDWKYWVPCSLPQVPFIPPCLFLPFSSFIVINAMSSTSWDPLIWM